MPKTRPLQTRSLPRNKLLRNRPLLFLGLALLQLAVPIYLAQSWNTVMAEGDTFRFALKASVTPEIRHGRYVHLAPSEDHGPLYGQVSIGDTVYAVIDKSNGGMANVLEVRTEPPEVQAYIAAKVADVRGGEAYLTYPFADYCLSDEELDRLKIESLKNKMNYTVTVKVKKGSAVAERLNFNQ
ncbi:MAG: hypothetical protein J6B02_00435 [Selenomonadales bacterium]|nr:hypothetical protein [Selenomonadales bacterium]